MKDADNDGVLDPFDRCPAAAEVHNGIDDQDGCPDECSGYFVENPIASLSKLRLFVLGVAKAEVLRRQSECKLRKGAKPGYEFCDFQVALRADSSAEVGFQEATLTYAFQDEILIFAQLSASRAVESTSKLAQLEASARHWLAVFADAMRSGIIEQHEWSSAYEFARWELRATPDSPNPHKLSFYVLISHADKDELGCSF